MVESSGDRASSGSPSRKGTKAYGDPEKDIGLSPKSKFIELKTPKELEIGDNDVLKTELLPPPLEEKTPSQNSPFTKAVIWMVVNTLATIAIVFTNKAIFSDPSLKLARLTFAAFHFFITWITLFVISRPRFAMFAPRRTAIREIMPLAITMVLNVILPNFSLAFSIVTFYQVARILLTPVVAIVNFVLYKSTLPRNAILALIPASLGVGMVSYYDSLPSKDVKIKTTSFAGIIFAFTGIIASSLYTVWIASYHKKLQMNSMQLLYNQATIAAMMLLYVIPFVDTFPAWTEVPVNRWVLIFMAPSIHHPAATAASNQIPSSLSHPSKSSGEGIIQGEAPYNQTVRDRAAVIIEPRFRSNIIPLILHYGTILGPAWSILIYTSPEFANQFSSSAALFRYIHVGQIEVRMLPQTVLLTTPDSINRFLTDEWIWESLSPAEHILFFQSESTLCGNSARSVEDYFEYDILGAAQAGNYVGGGSLSLRRKRRSSMVRVLEENDRWSPKVREDEDKWFFNKLREIYKREQHAGIDLTDEDAVNLPDGDVMHTFTVQKLDYSSPLAVHQIHRWRKEEGE